MKTIEQVAEYFGVDYATVYRLITSGTLRAIKVGGVWRVRVADIDRYERARANVPDLAPAFKKR
jgi:excisionase family DNA binding protein